MSSAANQERGAFYEHRFLYWDVQADKDKEYRDFIFSEYLPTMSRLGITVTDGWLRMAGAGPQIMAIGEGVTFDSIASALASREFQTIKTRLLKYVENYSKHHTRKSARRNNSRNSRAE